MCAPHSKTFNHLPLTDTQMCSGCKCNLLMEVTQREVFIEEAPTVRTAATRVMISPLNTVCWFCPWTELNTTIIIRCIVYRALL